MIFNSLGRYIDSYKILCDLYPERSLPPDSYGMLLADQKRKKFKKRNKGRK